MRTIWKYEFPITDRFTLELPYQHKILAAFVQRPNDGPGKRTACLWVEVDPDNLTIPTKFTVVGTGDPVPEGYEWVATFQDNPFIWHLYV